MCLYKTLFEQDGEFEVAVLFLDQTAAMVIMWLAISTEEFEVVVLWLDQTAVKVIMNLATLLTPMAIDRIYLPLHSVASTVDHV
jgi:hypothetical protein